MPSKPWILVLGMCFLGAPPVYAEVIQGVMTISQPD